MTLASSIAIAISIIIAACCAALLVRRKPAAEDPAARELRTEMQALREMTQQSIQGVSSTFLTQMQAVTSNVQNSLASTTSQLGTRLDSINRQVTEQINQSTHLMSSSSSAVGERMAAVQNTFAGLQKQVGEMTEQARQLSDLSRSVNAIEHVLRAPKMRGSFGEEQLESLLGLVFARQQFQMQYRFASGEIADAMIILPQGKVAVDSKFPLENFRRIAEAVGDDEKKAYRKEFLRDVRRRVDEIATKYVRPAEDTLPFALMYVPAENVYYETIIRDEEGNNLYRYCLEKRVVPVSPNSLYAYLQTILLGLKGLQVSHRAETIIREIESLNIELEKFGKAYETIGGHIRNAATKFDDGTKLLTKVELRVESLVGNGTEQAELFEQEKKSLGASANR
jgi:DNA recombination protein RmuC